MYMILHMLIWMVSADKILVILSSYKQKNTHSEYFKEIESLGNELTYKTSDSAEIKLKIKNNYLYSTIILMCPSLEGNKYLENDEEISVDELVKYSDYGGGNLIIFGDTNVGVFYRKLAKKFKIDFHEQGSQLYGESDKKILESNNLTAPEIIVPKSKKKISFSGIGLYFHDLKLSMSLLSSEKNQYVKNLLKEQSRVESSTVAVAYQGINNARAVFSGSLDICKSLYMTNNSIGNSHFCIEFTKWAIGLKNVHSELDDENEYGYISTLPSSASQLANIKKILVILCNSKQQDTYSEYFKKVSSLGNGLTYKISDSIGMKLENNNDYIYSTIILMCPSLEGNK